LTVIVSVGIFAAVGAFAEEDRASKAIVPGAKQVMDGTRKITMGMEKKGEKGVSI
jgi:hypothetical protein